MTRRVNKVPGRKRGRPNRGLTSIRKSYGGGYPLELTPTEMVSIRLTAARTQRSGMEVLINALRFVGTKYGLSREEVYAIKREKDERGEFMRRHQLDGIERDAAKLPELQKYCQPYCVALHYIVSAAIRKMFGKPPVRPTWIKPDIWRLYCEQSLTRSHAEPTLETYYAALRDGGML